MLRILAVLLLVSGALSSKCPRVVNTTGPPNLHPIDVSQPVFVRRVPNGELYRVGTEGNDFFHVLHLYGSNGYDYGYAQGLLLANEVNETLTTAWSHFVNETWASINASINPYHLPDWLIEDIVTLGLDAAVDNVSLHDSPYVDEQVFAEMRGLADASGLPYDFIRRLHFMPELIKGQCSIYGAWGNATVDGRSMFLRAFDWDIKAQLQNHPTVTVYHPANSTLQGNTWLNVGWAGWLGALTGYNEHRLAVGSIGISWPNYPPYFGTTSMVGVPFIFLMKQVMIRSTTIEDMISLVENATRTCDLLVGFGGPEYSRMLQYSASLVRVFNDTSLEPDASWHPRIQQVVYEGFDWDCPYYQHLMYQQITHYYGNVTAENTIRNITAAVTTGDLHVAIVDTKDNLLWVANHAPQWDVDTPYQKAFQRQFARVNATELFGKKYGA